MSDTMSLYWLCCHNNNYFAEDNNILITIIAEQFILLASLVRIIQYQDTVPQFRVLITSLRRLSCKLAMRGTHSAHVR